MNDLVTYSLWPCNLSRNGNQLASHIVFTDLGNSWSHCKLSCSIMHKNPSGLLFLVFFHEPRIHSYAQNKPLLPKHKLTLNMGSNSQTLCVWKQYWTNKLSLWWNMGFSICLIKPFSPVYNHFHVPSFHHYITRNFNFNLRESSQTGSTTMFSFFIYASIL